MNEVDRFNIDTNFKYSVVDKDVIIKKIEEYQRDAVVANDEGKHGIAVELLAKAMALYSVLNYHGGDL